MKRNRNSQNFSEIAVTLFGQLLGTLRIDINAKINNLVLDSHLLVKVGESYFIRINQKNPRR